MTNNDLQNLTQKTKDRATRTPLNTSGELGCSGRVCNPVPHVVPIVTLIVQPLNSATYIINRVKEWSMIETYFNVLCMSLQNSIYIMDKVSFIW